MEKNDKKSRLKIVLGIFCFIFSSDIIYKFVTDAVIRPIDWVFFGGFTLLGIAHIIEGLGFSLKRFFGKVF